MCGRTPTSKVLSKEGVSMFRILHSMLQGRLILGALVACASFFGILFQGGSAEAGRFKPQPRAILYQPPGGCHPEKNDDLVILRIGALLTNFTFAETECVSLPRWVGERASTCCLGDTSLCNPGVVVVDNLEGLCTALYTIE